MNSFQEEPPKGRSLKHVMVKLDPDTHRALKVVLALNGRSAQDVLAELVAGYVNSEPLDEHGRIVR